MDMDIIFKEESKIRTSPTHKKKKRPQDFMGPRDLQKFTTLHSVIMFVEPNLVIKSPYSQEKVESLASINFQLPGL